eukprot:6492280-Amphidinium_carterae.12
MHNAERAMDAAQPAGKRARTEEPGSWPARMLAAFKAVCGDLPAQARPLIVESVCTGLNTHVVGLQELTATIKKEGYQK